MTESSATMVWGRIDISGKTCSLATAGHSGSWVPSDIGPDLFALEGALPSIQVRFTHRIFAEAPVVHAIYSEQREPQLAVPCSVSSKNSGFDLEIPQDQSPTGQVAFFGIGNSVPSTTINVKLDTGTEVLSAQPSELSVALTKDPSQVIAWQLSAVDQLGQAVTGASFSKVLIKDGTWFRPGKPNTTIPWPRAQPSKVTSTSWSTEDTFLEVDKYPSQATYPYTVTVEFNGKKFSIDPTIRNIAQ